MTFQEYLVLFFMILGALFIFVASIGLLKMPDVYLRMSAATIAATFGVASVLIAAAIHFATLTVLLHITGIIIFLILTVPVGAHMLGRAAVIIGLKQWDKTVCNDIAGKYNEETHQFCGMETSASGEASPEAIEEK
jgi:multicomponent Na+:H+ antiporter subunit G